MGTNIAIVRAPNIVFLGAGASKALGFKVMAEFVSSLKESNPPDDELFTEICKQSDDLEYLFEQLAELQTKTYLVFRSQRGSYPQTDLGIAAEKLSRWLKQKVFLHYRRMNENDKNLVHLGNILQAMFQTPHPLVVFTTNYDPVVEVLCRNKLDARLIDGFRLDAAHYEYAWDRDVFDSASFQPEKKSLVLFKLHGSTNWVQRDTRIVKSAPMFSGDDDLHKNVLIFPATRKVAIEDPYFTSYDYLGKCLFYANRCLVIGYSFRDYDALSRFKAAQIENPNLAITVLDPKAEALGQFLATNGIHSTPLPYLVGLQEAQYLPKLTPEISATA